MTEDKYNEQEEREEREWLKRQEEQEQEEKQKPKPPRFREYTPKEFFLTDEMRIDHPKVKWLLDNWDDFIDQLVAMTDKVLDRKLDLIHTQLMMAEEQKKMVERDELYLYKQMIIEARVVKMEIEWATGIYEKEDKPVRKKKPKSKKKTEITSAVEQEPQTIEQDNDEQVETPAVKQLSLFNFDS
ncbi:MAG: hypothetical protein HY738_14060 [Bacteroidia bacterium]|nr:hypothetical protein [Bacteroidia bacterium]